MSKNKRPKGKPYPTRLDHEDALKLKEISGLTGIAEGTLIRYCVRMIVSHYRQHGHLPVGFLKTAETVEPTILCPAKPEAAQNGPDQRKP